MYVCVKGKQTGENICWNAYLLAKKQSQTKLVGKQRQIHPYIHVYRGCKSFFGQINLHWQQAVPVAHNAKYAANKSKLTNTNSGGGVRVTSPRGRGSGKRHSLGGHRMGALEHATTAAATWRPRKAGWEQRANSCCAANVKVASSREKWILKMLNKKRNSRDGQEGVARGEGGRLWCSGKRC